MRIFFLLSVIVIGICPIANGLTLPELPETSFMGKILSRGLPTHPLSKSSKELKIVPSYFTHRSETTDTRMEGFGSNTGIISETGQQAGAGWGVSLGFSYGFNSHFGLSFFGGHFSQKADLSSSEGPTGALNGYNSATNGGYVSNGQVFSLALIYDPFKKEEGFRCPIMSGLAYQRLSGSFDLYFDFINPPENLPFRNDLLSRVGHRGRQSFSRTLSSTGYMVGIAPQFNTGPFRWIPFAFGFEPIQKSKYEFTVADLTTGEEMPETRTSGQASSGSVGAFGLETIYRPWGLSFTYIPSIGGDVKTDVYSFKWTKKWGK